MSGPTDGTLSWRQLVDEAATRMSHALGGNRTQEARWLVERVSGYDAGELRTNADELVSSRSVGFFDALLARRCDGEPLQYVLGRWQFRTLELLVNRSVLIPRPETEVVAGIAIDAVRACVTSGNQSPIAVDLGTGSGAIALSLAAEVPHVVVKATDRSPDALAVARANLAGLGRAATRVTLHEGSWFDALDASLRGQVDVLVSNPPYVADRERADLATDVLDWEPHEALFADDDGRADIAVLVGGAGDWLAPGGVLVVEMSPTQTEWACELALRSGFVSARSERDLAGKSRALVAQRSG